MAGVMQYRDYAAILEYDDKANFFKGRVAGVGAQILFEGDSVALLRENFHRAVDRYLEECRETGVQPEKAYKGSFNVRIDPGLHRSAVILASEMNLTLNAFVEKAISHAVRRMRRRQSENEGRADKDGADRDLKDFKEADRDA